jgi:putative flippase GtrA
MSRFVKRHFWRLTRSVTVGAVGSVIALGVQWLLTERFGMWYTVAGVIGLALGALNNYFLNYYWSFRDVIHDENV